jgi:hypothetical protein
VAQARKHGTAAGDDDVRGDGLAVIERAADLEAPHHLVREPFLEEHFSRKPSQRSLDIEAE